MIISLNSYNLTDEHMLINDYDVIHTVSGIDMQYTITMY